MILEDTTNGTNLYDPNNTREYKPPKRDNSHLLQTSNSTYGLSAREDQTGYLKDHLKAQGNIVMPSSKSPESLRKLSSSVIGTSQNSAKVNSVTARIEEKTNERKTVAQNVMKSKSSNPGDVIDMSEKTELSTTEGINTIGDRKPPVVKQKNPYCRKSTEFSSQREDHGFLQPTRSVRQVLQPDTTEYSRSSVNYGAFYSSMNENELAAYRNYSLMSDRGAHNGKSKVLKTTAGDSIIKQQSRTTKDSNSSRRNCSTRSAISSGRVRSKHPAVDARFRAHAD